MKSKLLLFVPLLLLPSLCRSVEVKEINPRDRAVHVKYLPETEEGFSFVDVIGLHNGNFIECEIIDLEKGHLIFIGGPGMYKVSGVEQGKRFSKIVRVVDKDQPNPPPEPDDDEDEEDSDEDEDKDTDDDKLPETKWGVGPAIAKAFKPSKKQTGVAAIFDQASKDCQSTKNDIQTIALEIRQKIKDMQDPKVLKGYNTYRELFIKKQAANQIRSLKDFEGALAEVAEWLRK